MFRISQILTIIVILVVGASQLASAQARSAPWTVGASFNGLSYKNVQVKKYFNFTGMTGAPSIFIGRYLNSSFDVRLEYTYASVFYPQDNGFPNVINDQYRARDLNDLGMMLHFKFNNGYMFKEGWFSPYVFSGVGGNHVNGDYNFYVPVGAGINILITKNLSYHIRVAYKIGVDNTYDYTQYSTGLSVNFGKPVPEKVNDDDNDGVANALDACPDVIGLVELNGCPDDDGDGIANPDDDCPTEPGPEENGGCPWPDSDNDNVPDYKDKCPFTEGVLATMGCPDMDGDGVIDGEDNCPKKFGPAERNGCPLPDSDDDGVPDEEDACPFEEEDFDGFEDEDGCPDLDNDNDGILDMDDLCMNVPEDIDGYQDGDGCPDPDNDGDGINDIDDSCPDIPEDLDGFEDSDGCPDVDNDGDGITDDKDQCIDEAEGFNGYKDDDGCPDELPEPVYVQPEPVKRDPVVTRPSRPTPRVPKAPGSFTILSGTTFESTSNKIKPIALAELDRIIAELKKYPNSKWRIEGHSDAKASRSEANRLTKNQADAVLNYFISKGLPGANFRAVGFGDSNPIASNNTVYGKMKNRRIIIRNID
jgi:outer membrane protein OmpA-like peptidoglycan-associated protein